MTGVMNKDLLLFDNQSMVYQFDNLAYLTSIHDFYIMIYIYCNEDFSITKKEGC